MKLKGFCPSTTGHVGIVQFHQYAFPGIDNPMNARCSLCDWSEPWEGRNMIEHAESHGQGVECINCGVATLNLGLDALCTAHGGPQRCPRCQAYGHCYSGCDKTKEKDENN